MKRDSLFKGTFILSVSLILTKIIGLIYIIPFYVIIGGPDNMILFNYSYNYYVLILELSSAGIPLTLAKLVSKYNEEGNYVTSRKIAKVGSTILLVTGILGFLFFIFGSDYLAAQTIATADKKLLYSVDELSLVIKTLSLALPFVMISSGLRGIFQGHEIMMPTAMSQFVEQVIRIVVMLVGAYLVMNIYGNVVYANAVATLATGIGAIISVLILLYYYRKYKNSLDFNQDNNVYSNDVSTFSIVKEIFYVAIPFMIVSSFFSILTLIDQNTLIPVMDKINLAHVAEKEFNIYNNFVNKLVMIAVSLAPAFTGAFLPAITRLYAKKDFDMLSEQINKVLLALLMLVIPALVGMYALAEPLYLAFYSPEPRAVYFMHIYIPLALLYSLYGMTGIIMQAIDKQTLNVLIIILGLLFKYSLNEQFILKFETSGAIFCSMLTYILMIFLNIMVIHFKIKLKLGQFISNLTKIFVSSSIMFILISAIYDAIISNFNIVQKIDSVILIMICATVGSIIYFFVLTKMKFLKYLFGRNISILAIVRRR
ncbi:polysaccharide biosynthesis protein [Gemella sp. GH3]|uniref:putative polysaccharide biosynthesis protein n=1 Tax=unclassified Gemella TaxID=2624949 RepID=UPI0015D0B18B|nr:MULTISPECIES: polysaccharide biosynthesis protein [unclassified Gemella]MBF0714170.1 polysaccharide biosynthesis protein [Gemella sp. GH3.1]NYS51122.1 polysaccharide biosynthesis protein [Gemella sp. GH3]